MTLTGLFLIAYITEFNTLRTTLQTKSETMNKHSRKQLSLLKHHLMFFVVSMSKQYAGKFKYTTSSPSIFDGCLDGVFARPNRLPDGSVTSL